MCIKEYNTYAYTKKTIVPHKYFFEKLKIPVCVTLFFDFIFFIFFKYVLNTINKIKIKISKNALFS